MEFDSFIPVLLLLRAPSPTLPTPLGSRLPFLEVLQRPKACYSPALGFKWSPKSYGIGYAQINRIFIVTQIFQGSEPLHILRAKDPLQVRIRVYIVNRWTLWYYINRSAVEQVPTKDYECPLGKVKAILLLQTLAEKWIEDTYYCWNIFQADILVEGGDVTLIGWGTQVYWTNNQINSTFIIFLLANIYTQI